MVRQCLQYLTECFCTVLVSIVCVWWGLGVFSGNLHLLENGEEYTFTLPSAYARSILTVPWVELGGKVNVNCAKTGYSAAITFQTKPFYGGKLHRSVTRGHITL